MADAVDHRVDYVKGQLDVAQRIVVRLHQSGGREQPISTALS